MNPTSTKALIFIQAEPLSEMQQAAALLEKEGGIRTYYETDPQNALLVVKEQPASVIVYSVRVAEDLKLLLRFSADISQQVKAGSVILTILNQIDHPEIQKILKKMGCADIFEAPIKHKALRLKLARHLQLLKDRAERHAKMNLSDSALAEALGEQKSITVNEIDPLTHPSDCWILSPKTVKRFQNKWIFTVMGPGPRFGRWVSLNEGDAKKISDQDAYWVWTPSAPDGIDDFILNEPDSRPVQWMFHGRKPELNHMLWSMVSEKPELVLMKEGRPVARRFYLDARGSFMLPRNSKAAQIKIPRIKAGFEFEIRLKREKTEKKPDMEIKLDELFSADLELMLEPEELKAWNQKEAEPEADVTPRTWNFNRASTPAKAKFFEKTEPLLAPKTGVFELIEDRVTEKTYLQEAAETKCSVTIWTREQKFRQECHMRGFDLETTTITIENPVVPDGTPFYDLLKNLNADQVYFNINVSRGTLFFMQRSDAIKFQQDHFQLAVPPSLYEVQRRTHFRLPLKPQNPSTRFISLRLGLDQNEDGKLGTPYTLINVSRGGACLEIPAGLKRKFQIGDVLPNVTLQLYNAEVRCSAQVRWCHSGQFGVQFLKMPPYESETLHLFVMEESYEYLARYVMEPSKV